VVGGTRIQLIEPPNSIARMRVSRVPASDWRTDGLQVRPFARCRGLRDPIFPGGAELERGVLRGRRRAEEKEETVDGKGASKPRAPPQRNGGCRDSISAPSEPLR
jgi:hypothetical protein